YQSFHYCEPCWKQAKSALGLGTWTFVLVLFGAFSTLILAAAIAGTSRNPENQGSGPGVLLLLAPAALLAAFAGLFLLIRGVKHRRYPLRESQVAWGPAAFYVGSGFLDVQGHSTYKALRREWVALLVKANPEQVDDETYQAFANAPKPSVSPGTRPFGGS
ncbi:MAG: hypothetical protein KGI56_09375, partial [Acidobacteriota bacterium]|nr:hypothetical protein [Acidobacteriota bacterium]